MAQLPFAITPVAAAAGPDTTHAMHALRGAADAAHRKVLWISPSQAQANQARADDLADTTATLSDAPTTTSPPTPGSCPPAAW